MALDPRYVTQAYLKTPHKPNEWRILYPLDPGPVPPENNAILYDSFSGILAATFAKLITHPLERVDLYMRVQGTYPEIVGQTPKYADHLDCFKKLYADSSTYGLYKGSTAAIARYIPTHAMGLGLKDSIKSYGARYYPDEHFGFFTLWNVFAGGVGGLVGWSVINSWDYARAQKELAAQAINAYGKQSSGIVQLGWLPSVVGIFLYRGFLYGLYDSFTAINPYNHSDGMVGMGSKMAIATAVSATATFASLPFDMINQRLTTQWGVPLAEQTCTGLFDTAGQIMKEKGVSGFFQVTPTRALHTLAPALTLVLFDYFKREMGYKEVFPLDKSYESIHTEYWNKRKEEKAAYDLLHPPQPKGVIPKSFGH